MFNGNMSMPSLSDIAAVTGNDKNNGWGDNGAWWWHMNCAIASAYLTTFTCRLNRKNIWQILSAYMGRILSICWMF